eukprot:13626391-Alexandrium_andersonii.AAC.1
MLETLEPAISLGACRASGKLFAVTRFRLRFLFAGYKDCPPLEAACSSAGVAPSAAPPPNSTVGDCEDEPGVAGTGRTMRPPRSEPPPGEDAALLAGGVAGAGLPAAASSPTIF